ncbi:MAG: DUF1552 domain-containing protein [Sandaracinus sp.]|nr:DUF1552 domain-containing protein [Sandaracinus sp.]
MTRVPGASRLLRRTFLRGAGTVAVALPFLEEMLLPRRAHGAPGDVPTRLVTVFFGLGLDPSWQNDFDGPLEPYAPYADKAAFFRVNLGQGSEGGAHCNTSTVVFVGEKARSTNVAGGASIDMRLRDAVDPSAPVLASGLWWRRGACDAQALRVYNADGSARAPVKRPSQVFARLFGSATPPPTSTSDPDALRQSTLRRSVLDTVLGEYRHLTGDASPLGSASKQKIDQHLQAIREVERQLAPADEVIGPEPAPACATPDAPSDPDIGADYDRFTYGTGDGAPELDWRDAQAVFHLHADLYALALRCDLVRFGNLMFESAGGHMNLHGTYRALGDATEFPGTSQHDSYFHGNDRRNARLYQHFAQTCVSRFLERLDDAEMLEANGRTVLENATIVVGTEYGWNHDKNGVFHAVLGGGDRFRRGFFTDRRMNGIDLYNAILEGHGVDARIGSATRVASEGDGRVLLR